MAAEWLMHEGAVVPSALVLSHEEQLRRLGRYCREALDVAVVAGDPCLDRLVASRHLRNAYRAAFGLPSGRRLVVVSSTWGSRSLLGRDPGLLQGLLAELPLDNYTVAAVLHPNIWHGHSPWQTRAWLARCRQAGMVLVPPWESWRAALLAADVVVGDHGSVTMYAAALGVPVLIAADHSAGMDPDSPIARFVGRAPRLRPGRSLTEQLDGVIAKPAADAYADILAEATSEPGRSASLLRGLLYRWLGIDEPRHPAVTAIVPVPRRGELRPAAVTAQVVRTGTDKLGSSLRIERLPAELTLTRPMTGDSHLMVETGHHDPALLHLADLIILRADDTAGLPAAAARQALTRYPGALMAAAELACGRCVVALRGGPLVELAAVDPSVDVALLASVAYGWMTAGHDDQRAATVAVIVNDARHDVTITPPAQPRTTAS
ncbi:hypothetical protein ACQPYA_12960 [Micromonospora sp. CA-263727]|uniref:hypothetical protein n=1 Tax=Micromonospora sp. CA-263727 TaxID=3239967 RepID=UPI003D8A1839